MTFVNVLRLARSSFPERRQARLAALAAAAGGLGQLGTTIPLQLALTGLGWTATFAATTALTIALAAGVWLVVRDRPAGAPAPAAHAHAPIAGTLRAAARRAGTRHGFCVHASLMAPFAIFTAMWGVPYLQHAGGFSHAQAAALLLVCVAAFTAALPVVGSLAGRGLRVENRVVVGVGALVAATLTVLALWPGGAVPGPLLVVGLVVLGAGGAASIAAFDIARREAPPTPPARPSRWSTAAASSRPPWAPGSSACCCPPTAGPSAYAHAALLAPAAIGAVATAGSARMARRRRDRAAQGARLAVA